MTGSKPFHQFLQETLSPYGFLAERHLNASFSNAVGLKALGLGNASRRHHLLGSGLERQTVWSNHHAGQVSPAALRHQIVCHPGRVALVFSQLAHDEAVPFLEV
ncbi:MAG: hypothetical protein WBQ20_16620 [Methyloceanibacter sp.]